MNIIYYSPFYYIRVNTNQKVHPNPSKLRGAHKELKIRSRQGQNKREMVIILVTNVLL
jgi:hypothetical protein